MDRRPILTLSTALLLASSLTAFDAQEVYKRSVKLLTLDKIKFQVTSVMRSGSYTKKQVFTLFREENGKNSSSLVCFASPKGIKGTAILLKKSEESSSILVYFPSLGRSRIIPKENENDEAFGLGLSFAQIQNNTEDLKSEGEITVDDQSYYKLAKTSKKGKTLYLIDKQNMILEEIETYKDEKLEKKVIIDNYALLNGKKIITKWHIIDFLKGKETHYSVNTKTISTAFNKRVFKRSAINHCKP